MDAFGHVLCFCPSSRLSLASLVLSTWTRVQRYVLTDDESRADALDGFDAALVMDQFVTTVLVDRLAAKLPVVVLAWNGMFEIERYRQLLGTRDVIYMGTDETLIATDVQYVPMINGDCAFATWRELYTHKSQFRAAAGAKYRVRWLRTLAMPLRPVSVMMAAAGAARRPPVLRKTVESAIVRDKLVWAGNCQLDPAAIGLREPEQRALERKLAAIGIQPTPLARLQATLALLDEWRHTLAPTMPAERAHQAFYVTNTLLRWAVLAYLATTAKSATWFFGHDNLGLGLPFELYVHNLVPTERIAFLEFGGKTSSMALYPRALHLLARLFYVVAVPTLDRGEDLLPLVESIRQGLTDERHDFFARIERRRRTLYASLPPELTLRDAQARVWSDFARAH